MVKFTSLTLLTTSLVYTLAQGVKDTALARFIQPTRLPKLGPLAPLSMTINGKLGSLPLEGALLPDPISPVLLLDDRCCPAPARPCNATTGPRPPATTTPCTAPGLHPTLAEPCTAPISARPCTTPLPQDPTLLGMLQPLGQPLCPRLDPTHKEPCDPDPAWSPRRV